MMKQFFCLMILLAFFSAESRAQRKWGILAGAGLSKKSGYRDVGIDNTRSLLTVQAAVFTILPLHDKARWVMQPSLGYVPKGVVFQDLYVTDVLGNDIGRSDYKYRIDYLQLELPAGLQWKGGKHTRILAVAGPYFAYGFAGRQRYFNYESFLSSTNEKPSPRSIDFKNDQLNRFDAGLVSRVTTVFSGRFCAGIKIDFGLTNTSSVNSFKSYHRAAALTAGYIF